MRIRKYNYVAQIHNKAKHFSLTAFDRTRRICAPVFWALYIRVKKVPESYLKKNVYLEAWNAKWKKIYKSEKQKLERLIGNNCIEIQHIGSTSVKGIKAKPIVDILVVVESISKVDHLDFNGYEVKGENGISGRRYFQKDKNGKRLLHIHIYEKNHAAINSHILFRDSLKANKKLAKEYENLKIKLAIKFSGDKVSYTNAKAEFISNIINSV